MLSSCERRKKPTTMLDTITVLVTRACTWGCHYCNIYKQAGRYKELPGDMWIRFFNILKKDYGINPFVLLVGGEPLLYKDFIKLCKGLHNLDIPYTVITTFDEKANEKNIHFAIKECKGISTSVDPCYTTPKTLSCIDGLKKVALETLDRGTDLRPYGIVGETMFLHHHDTTGVPTLNEQFGIVEKYLEDIPLWLTSPAYIETVWKDRLNTGSVYNHYDLADRSNDKYLLTYKDWKMIKGWLKSNSQRVLFPGIQDRFSNMVLSSTIYLSHDNNTTSNNNNNNNHYRISGYDEDNCVPNPVDYCNPTNALTIEPNGVFRLCYRIGTPKQYFSTDNTILGVECIVNAQSKDERDEILNNFVKLSFVAKKEYCQGCYWQCPYMSMMLDGSDHQGTELKA